ncbi:ubiquitin-conjugating enzyme E2 W [Coemansia sp. RSA 1286]|nr:ubiquitin-conjugating enzyme E2 W [Coemansia sp. RSA 1286]
MGELKRMKADSISNIRLVNHESLTSWTMAIKGAEGTLYAGEAFTLRLNFPDTYPYEAPEAVFIGEERPVGDLSYVSRATSPKKARWRFDAYVVPLDGKCPETKASECRNLHAPSIRK